MKDEAVKFARDVLEAGIAGAATAVLALNLDASSAKTVIAVAFFGFLSAAIAAARRYLVTRTGGVS